MNGDQFWRGGDSAPGLVRWLRERFIDVCMIIGGIFLAIALSLFEERPPCPT